MNKRVLMRIIDQGHSAATGSPRSPGSKSLGQSQSISGKEPAHGGEPGAGQALGHLTR